MSGSVQKCVVVGLVLVLAAVSAVSGCKKKGSGGSSESAGSAPSGLNSRSTNIMAMNGQKVVKGIIVANIYRTRTGSVSVWPHNDARDGKSTSWKDIAGKSFSTSTEYFNELFDIQCQTDGDNWRPYVEGYEPAWLAAGDIKPHEPGRLTADNNAWIVVSGMTEEMGDFMPALISANVDVSGFPTSGQCDLSQREDKVGLDRCEALGSSYAVIITRGGQALTFKERDATLSNIFQQNSFKLPDGITLKYLRP